VSTTALVSLRSETIKVGQPWLAPGDGVLCVGIWVSNDAGIQGTPEDMDRLAEAAHAAAERARATEPELRAKAAGEGASS
jgi:hypothetical protein